MHIYSAQDYEVYIKKDSEQFKAIDIVSVQFENDVDVKPIYALGYKEPLGYSTGGTIVSGEIAVVPVDNAEPNLFQNFIYSQNYYESTNPLYNPLFDTVFYKIGSSNQTTIETLKDIKIFKTSTITNQNNGQTFIIYNFVQTKLYTEKDFLTKTQISDMLYKQYQAMLEQTKTRMSNLSQMEIDQITKKCEKQIDQLEEELFKSTVTLEEIVTNTSILNNGLKQIQNALNQEVKYINKALDVTIQNIKQKTLFAPSQHINKMSDILMETKPTFEFYRQTTEDMLRNGIPKDGEK